MRIETVLNKMKKEIILAGENEFEREQFLKHISNVKLLCELFLEEEEPASSKASPSSYSEQEIKAMLGEKKPSSLEVKQAEQHKPIDHDGANGPSLFDF